jgi:hypothetical protein
MSPVRVMAAPHPLCLYDRCTDLADKDCPAGCCWDHCTLAHVSRCCGEYHGCVCATQKEEGPMSVDLATKRLLESRTPLIMAAIKLSDAVHDQVFRAKSSTLSDALAEVEAKLEDVKRLAAQAQVAA